MPNVLQPHHHDQFAARHEGVRYSLATGKLRDGYPIVPACGSRFADFPRDLRLYGFAACLVTAAFMVSAAVLAARFVAVL